MAKINFPIHVLPFLIFKLKSLKGVKQALLAMLKLVVNMMRSIMFMTTYVSSICVTQQMADFIGPPLSVSNYSVNQVIGIISTMSIAWEQTHRQKDLVLFIIPSALESYGEMLKNRKLVTREIPSYALIALACAVIGFRFSEENSEIMHQELSRKQREVQNS